jgi:hypothetical protein
MRPFLVLTLLALSFAASASSTLRVGSHVLVAGDSEARASELLGKPKHKSHHRARRQGRRGGLVVLTPASEQWLYLRDGHTTTVTFVDGRITEIEDRRR